MDQVEPEVMAEPACASWASLTPDTLPALPNGPYVETLEVAWELVRRRHPDPTLRCLPWPELRREYGEKIAAATTREEAYALLNELLGSLKESHIYAWPPQAAGRRIDGDGAIGRSEARFVILDGAPRMVGEEARARGYAGAVLMEVDGVEIAALHERGAGRPPSMRGDARLRATLDEALRCREGQQRGLKVAGAGAAGTPSPPRVVQVGCAPLHGARVSLGHLREIPTRVRAEMIPETGIGSLAFNVWMLPMLPTIREAMRSLRAQGMTELLIDLRGNPGGVGSMVMPVGRMLIRADASLGELRMRDHVQRLVVAGEPDAFAGPVTVLVDEATASTSEIFAQGMRDIGRVSVVGAQTSAGMALPSVIEALPDGGALQLVVGYHQSPSRGAPEGRGVTLDVTLDVDPAALMTQDDPVRAAALHWMLQRERPRGSERGPSDHRARVPR